MTPENGQSSFGTFEKRALALADMDPVSRIWTPENKFFLEINTRIHDRKSLVIKKGKIF